VPKTQRWIIGLLIVVACALVLWLRNMPNNRPSHSTATPTTGIGPSLRIGIIPERDIFQQRRRYMALANYLSIVLEQPVELVTVNSYESILNDLSANRVDAAFLGSMVTVLAVDRMNVQILVKPELPGGVMTYRGVIFVADSSPIRTIDDLSGRSIATVRATTAGDLYPMYELSRRGVLDGPNPPRFIWVGTHDDVMLEVNQGRVEAGAAKDQRLDDYIQSHPDFKVRRLGQSDSVPENSLVISPRAAKEFRDKLRGALLDMDSTPEGRAALQQFGALRFVPCKIDEYQAIYRMLDGVKWQDLGVQGPAPLHPNAPPSTKGE
jgi:phosphonate transport system substrate-binding protein